jgi:integrase
MTTNLLKRGGVFHVVAMVEGRRRMRSTHTGDESVARKMRKPIIDLWRKEAFAEEFGLGKDKVVRSAATVGDAIDAYRNSAEAAFRASGEPRPATATGVVCALVRVLEDAGVAQPRSLLLAKLDGHLLAEYAERKLAVATDLVRARRTVASTINQARAMFSRWAQDAMRKRGVDVPSSLQEFLRADVVTAEPVKYVFPPLYLVERTEAAGAALGESQPNVWLAYMLALAGGLRAGEIAAARWSWLVREADGSCYLRVRQSAEWKSKTGKDRDVRLHPETWARIGKLRAAREFILEGDTFNARRDVVTRELSKWMRDLGWEKDAFPKAAHELRKLAGARWYTAQGLSWAAKWLGDREDTTYRFYADLDPRSMPLPAAVG